MHKQSLSGILALTLASTGAALAQPAAEPAAPTAAEAAPAAADEPAPAPAATEPEPSPMQARLREQLAQPGGLTAQEVGRRAAATSYSAVAADRQIDAAEAQVDQAFVSAWPRLQLTARYTRLSPIEEPELGFGSGPGGLVTTTAPNPGAIDHATNVGIVPLSAMSFSFPAVLNNYYLQAGLTVPLSDYIFRTSQSVKAARHSKRAATLQAHSARVAASAQAKTIYYNWVRMRLQQVVAEQSLDQAREQLRIAKVLFEAGRGSKADVLRAESLVANTELLVERARNGVILAEDQMRTAMHDKPEAKYQIGEDITAQARRVKTREDLQKLLAESRRNRLELRAMDETRRSLGQARRVVQAGNVPRLDAFANAYLANPHQRYFPQQEEWNASWDVGVQLTWSPNDFGMAGAEAAGFEAQRAQIEAERRALEDAIRAQVVQAHQDMQVSRVAMGTSERSLEAAREGHRVRSMLFRHGRATSVEVIDAETTLLAARLEIINAQIDLLIARMQLDHAVGRDVPANYR